MVKKEAIEKLEGFEPRPRALGATSLHLFGPTARGDAGATSDIDLLIDIAPAGRFSIFELVRAKHMFEDELQRFIDLGTRDGLHPSLRRRIEDVAIRIF